MKPILFSTDMVKAIQTGRKTQTRRVIKQKYSNTHIELKPDGAVWEVQNVPQPEKLGNGMTRHHVAAVVVVKPAYQPGDILWVRETWRVRNVYGDFARNDRTAEIEYRAGGASVYVPVTEDAINGKCWRPSIFMPKAAARIFLRVTEVRAERLQDISQSDAIDEGIPGRHSRYPAEGFRQRAIYGYSQLWDSINKKRGYGWDTNPWVWVYTFERR